MTTDDAREVGDCPNTISGRHVLRDGLVGVRLVSVCTYCAWTGGAR